MLAVNYSTLRNNLKSYCDRATEDAETIFITRKDEKNLVMMSLDSYNNLMENIFIRSSQKNYQHILETVRYSETVFRLARKRRRSRSRATSSLR